VKKPVLLTVLQCVGAVSLLPYPLAPLAAFFGLISLPQSGPELARGYALIALILTYPFLFAALWWTSWVAQRRGRAVLALALSTPPAAVTLAVGIALAADSIHTSRAERRDAQEFDAPLRAENPLAADLLKDMFGSQPQPDLHAVIAAADPAMLSKPVTKYGTPLAIAVRTSQLDRRMSYAQSRDNYLAAARQLIDRGAHLAPEEQATDASLVWCVSLLAHGTPLPDPAAQSENPLVWQIVTTQQGFPVEDSQLTDRVDELARTDPGALTKETRTYGSPLAIALRRNWLVVVDALVSHDVLLSPTERREPALRHALEERVRAHLNDVAADAYLGKMAN